jgi:hypothetical protein
MQFEFFKIMGDQVVYSFKSTGILLYERGFYLTPGRTQWDIGTLKSGFQYQAAASGPTKIDDLPQTLYNMYQSNIKPFLVVQFDDNSLREKYFMTPWTDAGTGGADWNAIYLNGTIINAATKAADYICLGDTVVYNNSSSIAGKKFLFAHKSIVASMTATPGRTWKEANQTLFYGDVNRGQYDETFMYASIGHNVTNDGTAPVVLRCFLEYAKASNVVKTLVEDNWDVKITTNVLGPKGVLHIDNCIQTNEPEKHYFVINTVEGALLNLAKCVLREAKTENNEFQGFYVTDTASANEERARKFMIPLCNSDFPDPILADYPKICACLGRKGAEDALRAALKKGKEIRMVCQSTDCINGQRDGGVFTFTPSPPCSPINICMQSINAGGQTVTLENVNLTCNQGEIPLVLTEMPTGSPPGTTPPPPPGVLPVLSIPGLPGLPPPPPLGSNVAAGGGSNAAAMYAGIAIGVLLFIAAIIVIVVFVVKRRRAAAAATVSEKGSE